MVARDLRFRLVTIRLPGSERSAVHLISLII